MEIEKSLELLVTAVTALSQNMDMRFDKMEERMDGLETRMERMETRMEKLETDVAGLKTDVGKLQTDVAKLRMSNEQHIGSRAQGDRRKLVRHVRERQGYAGKG